MMLRFIFLVSLCWLAMPALPLPAKHQQSEEERRREAERAAAERARQAEMRRQEQERREEFKKLRPPTAAERLAVHKRQFPDFLKNIRKLDVTSREIASYGRLDTLNASTEKIISGKAKSLENQADGILHYVLYDAKAPEPSKQDFSEKPMTERIRLVGPMSRNLLRSLNAWLDSQKRSVSDIHQTGSLIAELQSFKLLAHSLRR